MASLQGILKAYPISTFEITLGKHQLIGSIPSSISTLSNLTRLSLRDNKISDSIPSSISCLTNLTKLFLDGNQISGSIPHSISCLTQLNKLVLSNNNISGEIPSNISCLVNLEYLLLDDNKLTGDIPIEISSLTKLKYLFIHNNQLSGYIPNSISYLTNLVMFTAHKNDLSGHIPIGIGLLRKLKKLSLYKNNLSGEIPENISTLTKLTTLWLHNNNLCGKIPNNISKLKNLTKLYLENNNLTGNIPTSLSYLTNLQSLYLNNNNLSGKLPQCISNLPNLTDINLNDNYFEKSQQDYKKRINSLTDSVFREMRKSLEYSIIQNELPYDRIWNTISLEYKWETKDINIIRTIEKLLSQDSIPNDMNILAETKEYFELHEYNICNWNEMEEFLNIKYNNTTNFKETHSQELDKINLEHTELIIQQNKLKEELKRISQLRFETEQKREILKNEIELVQTPIDKINNLIYKTKTITLELHNLNENVKNILSNSNFLVNKITEDEFIILLEKMNLEKYSKQCIDTEIHKYINTIHEGILLGIGFTSRDASCFLYNIEMMKYPGYISDNKDIDCIVCEHNTPIKTIELLEEWNIKINRDIIIKNNWIAPYFLFLRTYKEFGIEGIEVIKISNILNEWRDFHIKHLNKLKK